MTDNKSTTTPKPQQVTKIKPRCACCNKKISLISLSCTRCKLMFCIAHRFPEAHDCKCDDKTSLFLPPAVTFSKLEKI